MNTDTSGASTNISRHWLDIIEDNHITFMVLTPQHDKKLIEQLQSRPDWVVEFATEEALFFARTADNQAQ